MRVQRWKETEVERMNDLVTRQVLHTEMMTIARLEMRKGAVVPEHHHVNEQISTVEKGRLLFQFPEAEVIVGAGESLVIAPNLPHRVEALEDSVAIDSFSPPREDWIRGDDAYLRR